MKKTIIILVLLLMAVPSLFAQSKAGRKDTAAHAKFYSCLHHPEVTSLRPGKCSICGMDLHLSGKEQMKTGVVKNYNCPVHLDVTGHNPGQCPKCGKKMSLSLKEQMKAETVKLYTCPMHPEVALNKDGICPKCGKELVEKKKSR
ncbi:MAG: heavy metal-binding domain-containing protein [Chitinophagaceae bacterium]